MDLKQPTDIVLSKSKTVQLTFEHLLRFTHGPVVICALIGTEIKQNSIPVTVVLGHCVNLTGIVVLSYEFGVIKENKTNNFRKR